MFKPKNDHQGPFSSRLESRLTVGALALAAVLSTRCSANESFKHSIDTATIKHDELKNDPQADFPEIEEEDEITSTTIDAGTPEPKSYPYNLFIEDGDKVPAAMSDVLSMAIGNKWLGQLEGNGGRDAALFMPLPYDAELPTEVIYHFHGSNGETLKGPARNRLEQAVDSCRFIEGSNVVLVYPLSAGPRGVSEIRDYDWMHIGRTEGNDDIRVMHEEVLEILDRHFQIEPEDLKITLKGHSAGGKAVENALRSLDYHGWEHKVDRVDSLESSYGNWARKGHAVATKMNPNVEVNLFIIPDSRGTHKTTSSPGTRRLIRDNPDNLEVILEDDIEHAGMNCAYMAWDRQTRKRLECEKLGFSRYRLKEDSIFEGK